MGQLTEIYNRLGEEFDKASREHFDAALNGKKNGNRIYYHGKMHGIYIAIKIVEEILNNAREECLKEDFDKTNIFERK